MADEDIKTENEKSTIDKQVIAAGKEAHVDLSHYFSPEEEETLEYEIEDLPEGLTIDSKTGIITGPAPATETNQSYTPTLITTSSLSKKRTKETFNLEIIGTLMLDTPEARAFFGLEPVNFWDMVMEWEIRQFIQRLIDEHFVWIYVYDANRSNESSGKFLSKRKATSGWLILEFENVVMITPGEMAYEQYGNRGRLIKTLGEVYRNDVPKKGWKQIGLGGSDVENIGRAWIVAQRSDMSLIKEEAPTDSARVNYDNLNKIDKLYPPELPKPTL